MRPNGMQQPCAQGPRTGALPCSPPAWTSTARRSRGWVAETSRAARQGSACAVMMESIPPCRSQLQAQRGMEMGCGGAV